MNLWLHMRKDHDRGLARPVKCLLIWGLSFALSLPLTSIADQAFAQSYAAGYKKYTQADFDGAERSLIQALKRNPPRPERAKILKLLGIVQYILGKKGNAQRAFELALQTAPDTSISAGESLDPSVVPFFNGIKSQVEGQKREQAQAQARAEANIRARAQAKVQKSKENKTYLRVVSNVKDATVMIDGILAGQVNSLINAEPGKVLIEVDAPGFIKRTVRSTLQRGQENTVKVDLSRPQPKPTPSPKPEPKVAVAANQRDRGGRAGGNGGRGNRRPGNAEKVFAPDPGDAMFEDPDVLPPAGGDIGYGGGGQDLASEFNRDAAQGAYGGYAAPPPTYAQPAPAYPAPVYPAPFYPAPVAPPPVYPYPAAPPAPPPPSGYDPYADPIAANDPAAQDGPDVSLTKRSSGGASTSTFWKLTPFGGGQFARGDTLLGLAFLAAEGGALAFFFIQSQEAANVTTQTEAEIKELQRQGQPAQNVQDFRNARQTYVNELNSQSVYGLVGFGGIWALGVVEAFVNEPTPKKRKKRRSGRRYRGFGENPPTVQEERQIAQDLQDERPNLYSFQWDLGVTPAPQLKEELKPAVAVEVKWSF